MKKPYRRLICALLCVLMLLGSFSFGTVRGEESYDCYTTHGFRPALPINADTLDVTSVDYYFENKDDTLPGLHGGIDIYVSMNTPVLSVADGTVTQAKTNNGYGNNIIVKHEFEGRVFYSRYAHLSSYKVSVGDKVQKGQTIALSGNSGTYSPHLHLEIYEHGSPAVLERAYTLKYYLGQGADVLSRLKFYGHFIDGEYNSQMRVNVFGNGASCYPRCARTDSHNHISVFANYIKKFYTYTKSRYVYDSSAEQYLFKDSKLRAFVYENFDTDGDGHLSFTEAMSVDTLDLRDVSIGSLDGCDIFENVTGILSDPVYNLKVSYKVIGEYSADRRKCGTWKHTDTKDGLLLREAPTRSSAKVGRIPPDSIMVITETVEKSDYLWGKAIYDGAEGWCALDPSWSVQLSSVMPIYIDTEGYLRDSITEKLIADTIYSTDSTASLLTSEALSFLPSDKMLVGWSACEGGEAVRVSEQISILELCPQLSEKDSEIVVFAVIRDSNIAGDCNGDGCLDEGDVQTLIRYSSGYRDLFVREEYLDYNHDGKINNRDIINIKRKIANLPPVS